MIFNYKRALDEREQRIVKYHIIISKLAQKKALTEIEEEMVADICSRMEIDEKVFNCWLKSKGHTSPPPHHSNKL